MSKYVYIIVDEDGCCDYDSVIYNPEIAIREALTGAEIAVLDCETFKRLGTIRETQAITRP